MLQVLVGEGVNVASVDWGNGSVLQVLIGGSGSVLQVLIGGGGQCCKC